MTEEDSSSEEYAIIDGIAERIARLVSVPTVADNLVAPVGEEILDSDITFDRSLPGLHTYLGEDVVNVDGRNHIQPGEILNLRAFYRPGIILVPGYTLPLLIQEATQIEVLRAFKDSVAILPGCFSRRILYDDFVGRVATIADLMTIRQSGNLQNPVLLGRQRLEIISVQPSYESNQLMCTGRVLPEMSVEEKGMASNPFGLIPIPPSWCRFAPEPDFPGARSTKAKNESESPATADRFVMSPRPGHPLAIFDSSLSTWRPSCPPEPISTSPIIPTGDESEASSDPEKSVSTYHLLHGAESGYSIKRSLKEASESTQLTSTASSSPTFARKRRKRRRRRRIGADTSNSAREPVTTKPIPPSPPEEKVEHIEVIVKEAVDRHGRPFHYRLQRPSHRRLLCRRDVLASVAHSILPFPAWVYRQYDTAYLVAEIRSELSRWTNTWHLDHWNPTLAVPFSFWLVQNLPLPCSTKAQLLEIDHVVQRLRAILHLTRKFSQIVCVSCRRNMSSQRDVICLAQEGSLTTYVNPHGIVFDMLTLSRVIQGSIELVGDSSTDYSWFPGYAWTIAQCAGCYNHVGWLFTATSEDLRPRMFWGIKRDAIVPSSEDSSTPSRLML
uniref:Protein cereblon n=3 Tax=Schistocephalus solidus TaxID=70667 RepID=A0A0X3P211_SCHSO